MVVGSPLTAWYLQSLLDDVREIGPTRVIAALSSTLPPSCSVHRERRTDTRAPLAGGKNSPRP